MWVKVLIWGSFLIGLALADNLSNCDISELDTSAWQFNKKVNYNDNVNNQNVFESTYTGNLENLQCDCIDSSSIPCTKEYLTYSNNDTYFISTTINMETFDEDMLALKVDPTVVSIYFRCTMTCEDKDQTSSMIFVNTVSDYNDFAPELSADSTYKVASPIMPQTDFTVYGAQISATDKDFSNTKISFTITPEGDFDVVSSVDHSTIPETFYLNFRAKKIMHIQEPVKYTITATDNGIIPEPKHTTMEISLELDEDNSLETTTFIYPDSSGSYKIQYEENNTLTYLNGVISVKTSAATNIKNAILTGDLSDHFISTYNPTTAEVAITIKTNIDSPPASFIILTLSLDTYPVVSTPIIIYFTNVPSDTSLKFDKHLYTGTYDDIKTEVNLDSNNIQIITTSNIKPDFTISGDFSDRFSVELDSDSKSYVLKVITPLSVNEIKSNDFLALTIKVTINSNSDTAGLVITLPVHNLEFTEILYTATYNNDNTVTMDESKPIDFKSDVTIISITVEEKYVAYFKVVSESNKYNLKEINKLPDSILISETEIVVIITATDKYNNQKQAAIQISLPLKETTDLPKFSKPYYTAKYTKGQTDDYIDFNPEISFENIDDVTTVNIVLSNKEYFEAEYNSNKWRIHVKTPIDEDTMFNSYSEIITTMEATKDVDQTGVTVLVIELVDNSVDEKVPKFKDAYYSADYPKSGTGTIYFNNDLVFVNVDDLTKVTVTVTDYDNFDISYDVTLKKWKIEIKSPISISDTDSYIISTISAKIGDNTNTPIAAFVLNLPENEIEEAPVFNKTYYKGSYAITGTTAVVTLDDSLGFNNKLDMSQIKIISDEYSSYFTFNYESNKWQIDSKILEANILKQTNLLVAITATDSTNDLKGHSVIDLNLPIVNTDDAPKFSMTYYTGQYLISADNKFTVTLDSDIEISNRADLTNVKISTDKYVDNFLFSYTSGKWEVTVDQGLDQAILNEKIDIVMGLIATDNSGEIGTSALVLSLPIINDNEAPKFNSISYQSSCTSKTTQLDSEIKITNKKDLSAISVSFLETDYNSNFETTFNSTTNSWFVKVNSIPADLSQSDLILTLTAVETGNEENIGQAALVINFPVLTAPKFSKNQYYGKYTVCDSSELDADIISIDNKDDKSVIKVSFNSTDGDFSTNFIPTYDPTSKTWKMTKSEPLTDSQIKDKTEIILTLIATEDDNDNLGIATLIIHLIDNNDNKSDINFAEIHYTGSYDPSGVKPVVKLDKNITITSSQDISTAEVKIESADNFDANKYFTITKNSDYYEVTVKVALPEDILEKQKSLVMTLEAILDTNKNFATLVLNLPVQTSESSIKFESPLYNGEYKVSTDGDVDFSVDTAIIISDEDSDNIDVTISEDSTYGEYFNLSISDKKVQINSKSNLPEDVYTTETVAAITLKATIHGTTVSALTVVNIKISYDQTADTSQISFTLPVYSGKYDVTDNKASISHDKIEVDTDQEDDNIIINILYDQDQYFNATYSNKEIKIVLLKTAANENLRKQHVIPVVLEAKIKDTQHIAQTVINFVVHDNDNGGDDTSTVSFPKILYDANYTLENDHSVNFYIDTITLTGDRTDDEIDIKISNEYGYDKYFDVSCSHKQVIISPKGFIPKEDIKEMGFLAIKLHATTVTNTSIYDEAILNIKLNHQSNEKEDKVNITNYIIAVSILVILIVLLIAGAIAIYYFKIRHLQYKKMTEDEYINNNNHRVKFDKSSLRNSGEKRKHSSVIENRRPTGFIFNSKPSDDLEPRESTTEPDTTKERKKSVAFDENVEKLQLDANDDDIEKPNENTD